MRYAIKRLSDGLIVNAIVLDAANAPTWPLEPGHVLIEAETDGGLGDTHDGVRFIRPPAQVPIPQPRDPLVEIDRLQAALKRRALITDADLAPELLIR